MNKPSLPPIKLVAVFLMGVIGFLILFSLVAIAIGWFGKDSTRQTDHCVLYNGKNLQDVDDYYREKIAEAESKICNQEELKRAVSIELQKRLETIQDKEERERNKYVTTLLADEIGVDGLPKIPEGMYRSAVIYNSSKDKAFYFEGPFKSFESIYSKDGVLTLDDETAFYKDIAAVSEQKSTDYGSGYVTDFKHKWRVTDTYWMDSIRINVAWYDNDRIARREDFGDAGSFDYGFKLHDARSPIDPGSYVAESEFKFGGGDYNRSLNLLDSAVKQDGLYEASGSLNFTEKVAPLVIGRGSNYVQAVRVLIPTSANRKLRLDGSIVTWENLWKIRDTQNIEIPLGIYTGDNSEKFEKKGSFTLDLRDLSVTNITPKGLLTEY